MVDFYTVQFAAGETYPAGAGEVYFDLDASTQAGETADIFADSDPRFIHVEAGLTLTEISAVVEWTPGGTNFGSGLVILDTALNVLVDGRFYSTFPGQGGAGGVLEAPDLPYTMPSDGYIAMTFDNDSGITQTTTGPHPDLKIEVGFEGGVGRKWWVGVAGWSG